MALCQHLNLFPSLENSHLLSFGGNEDSFPSQGMAMLDSGFPSRPEIWLHQSETPPGLETGSWWCRKEGTGTFSGESKQLPSKPLVLRGTMAFFLPLCFELGVHSVNYSVF